ncbi:hypothetical protein ABBQ32_008699 [Trebouxia sp. C0010 RCD-2024]
MQQFLRAEWGIAATVLRDTPPHWFHRTGVQERHELFTRLAADFDGPTQVDGVDHLIPNPHSQQHVDGLPGRNQHKLADDVPHSGRNVFTHLLCGQPRLRTDRPALIVSSTSWTVDEDFLIMLDAAGHYEQAALNSNELPDLFIAITGKGPLKASYEEKMQQLGLQHVAFKTLWLEAADYPLLLGSADLGICLHTSSSGLDLPMKVVDMFGCGLPVCAASYSCIRELVKEGQTGLLFSSHQDLAQQWIDLLRGFPNQPSAQLVHMQKQVLLSTETWSMTWDSIKPIFE